MTFVRSVVIISSLLLVCACGSSASPILNGPSRSGPGPGPSGSVGWAASVRVALGIYSGRPDPEWTLTAVQAAALDEALAGLAEITGTPRAGGLGYHGFTIMRSGSTLVAYRGAVAPPGDGQRTFKSDPTRSIERYLLETSTLHVTADEYAAARQAVAEP